MMVDDDLERGVSLYFQLAPGKKADLEVVAEAAGHWAAAIRAAAREIDPNATVSFEFVDAVESSLRLNTFMDWAESHLKRIEDGGVKHWRVKKLAATTVLFLVFTAGPTYQSYFGKPELSDEDRTRIDELIELVKDKPAVREGRMKFYRSLERDPAIKAVGVAERRNEKPVHLVRSEDFAALGGLWEPETEENERTIFPVVDVILISPALVAAPRAWRFKPEGLDEFSATMKDQRFLDALKLDHVRERLRIGIPMTLRLKIEEKNVGGVWERKRGGRSVIEVISPAVD